MVWPHGTASFLHKLRRHSLKLLMPLVKYEEQTNIDIGKYELKNCTINSMGMSVKRSVTCGNFLSIFPTQF